MRPDAGTEGDPGTLEAWIEAAGELLPQQAPLNAFVHHNPLHHLEHLPFERAVVEGAKRLGNECFQSEVAFAEHLRSGRIRDHDIDAVLDATTRDRVVFPGGPTLRAFRGLRLRHLFEIPSGPSLRWLLEERSERTRLHAMVSSERRRTILLDGAEAEQVAELWERIEAGAPRDTVQQPGPRPRDWLAERTGMDPDAWVHPLLIRLSAAFLDQGIAYWSMPARERGLLGAFRQLYGRPMGPPLRWARGLSRCLAEQERQGWSAEATIEWALDELGVVHDERREVVACTLLSLRGWAGMMRYLELRPDRAPVEPVPASLADYLAVQLTLDVFAARACAKEYLGREGALAELRQTEAAPRRDATDLALVYEAFVLAQISDVPLARFSETGVVQAWLRDVSELDGIERRKLLHLAYERRHRVEVLDGLAIQARAGTSPIPAPAFQAVFCIDDREESLRRHLEEIEPAVETFGYAGFFGVAMDYQGLDDVRARPLCPVVVDPVHYIAEVSASAPDHEEYAQARRRRGRLTHAMSIGSRTLVRGGFAMSLLGPLSTIPLVARAFFPRIAHDLTHKLRELGLERPVTRLAIEAEPRGEFDSRLRAGYEIDEMAAIVSSALGTMGLDPNRSRVVLIVGHGSSSLNNPHEAAHDCGATGGGRGGPNARAFAAMANHPGVRLHLAEQGAGIPQDVWFLGAYHNTCDDEMTWYDEDLVPSSHRDAVEAAKRALVEACARDAHERCRRFESAPAIIGVERAVKEAQEHAVDLAQPRPEYGHATNAVCVVGRRSRTRGLFLDRRAFLVSYDPLRDPEGERLAPLLLSVGPVGAGINLEYYFSYIDPTGYGCGTKLPHNIVGLLGVMDGHASDLRTGLPWQMVEIHEPVRLLTIVDARRELLEKALADHAPLARLVGNGWIQLACWEPESGELFVFEDGAFRPHRAESAICPEAASSVDYYGGHRGHLPPARIGIRGARP